MATPATVYSCTRHRIRQTLACLMTAGLILGHCSAWAGQTTLAIAANFTGTMAKLIPVFEQQTGHHVRASYGSTGKLYAQIRQGAPFDAFMAADHKRPHLLVQDGLAVPGTQLPYAEGRLALWSRTEGLFSDGMSYLQSDPSRLAIGNPKTAPYGIAAMEFLDNLHLTEILKPKLVSGDSIAQTFQFVATGNAEAGFVALSQVWAWQGSAGSLWLIPRQLHQPISQHVILLNRGSSNPATLAWMEFLQSTKAQAIIREDGYDIPH